MHIVFTYQTVHQPAAFLGTVDLPEEESRHARAVISLEAGRRSSCSMAREHGTDRKP